MLQAFNTINSIVFLLMVAGISGFALIVLPPWKRIWHQVAFVFAWSIFFIWYIASEQTKALKRWWRSRKIVQIPLSPVQHLYHGTNILYDNNIPGAEEMPPVMSDQMN